MDQAKKETKADLWTLSSLPRYDGSVLAHEHAPPRAYAAVRMPPAA